jgi:hypothetical protein
VHGVSVDGLQDVAPAVPETVLELAASCVRFVQAAVGIELDLTHETLPILDHYLIQAREEISRRPEAAPLVAGALGAYFGQVIAAEFGGYWRAPNADMHSWLVCLQPVFLALSPVGVAYEALFEGAAHPGPPAELKLAREDREFVEQRLAAVPPVSEAEFYSFSGRFDALSIAVDALLGQMEAGGQEDVSFELGDYEDEFGDI